MSSRRRFLQQSSMAIGALITPLTSRPGLAKADLAGPPASSPQLEFKPTMGTWSVEVGGEAPWSATDLSISIEIDGQEHRSSGAFQTSPVPAPDTAVLGAGRSRKYTLPRQGDRPTFRMMLTTYDRPARLRLHYEVENDTGKDIRLGQATIRAILASPGWDEPLRIFINSGSQGFSGSRALEGGGNSAYLGMLVPHADRSNLLVGFISYRRTDGFLHFQRESGHRIEFKGSAPYNNVRLPVGHTLLGEDLELLASLNPHELVEGYATDVVRMHGFKFNHDLTGYWNVGYSHGEPKDDSVTEQQILGAADALDQTLGKYGVRYLGTCFWQNGGCFGVRKPWPDHYPDGLTAIARILHERGYGLLTYQVMAKVSATAEVYTDHPEWLIRDDSGKPAKRRDISWRGCLYPYYDLDITHPEAAASFADWATELCRGGLVNYLVLSFEGTSPGFLYDDTVCGPFEVDRRRLGILRQKLGPQGKIGTSTAPTNRHVGLVDRVRMALDGGVYDRAQGQDQRELEDLRETLRREADQRWKHVMDCARNMAAAYFYHGKFWWNDADPSMVGDHDFPETLEEARVRLMYTSLTGSYANIGQPLADIAPSRLRLLKMSLPTVGMAAKPVDLFRADVTSRYHWHLKTDWDAWEVITLVNWESQERVVELELSDFGVAGPQWIYELWTDTYHGEVSDHASFTLPPGACRVYAIRSKREHPWFLATDLHVGMGYHELTQVQWEAAKRLLTARVERPADMPGRVFAVVPKGWRLAAETTAAHVDGELLRIPVDFGGGPVSLSLHFERS